MLTRHAPPAADLPIPPLLAGEEFPDAPVRTIHLAAGGVLHAGPTTTALLDAALRGPASGAETAFHGPPAA